MERAMLDLGDGGAGVANARKATLALLARRPSGSTICPSEIARVLARSVDAAAAPESWRDLMPGVHEAIDRLLAEGRVRLSWKGKALPTRAGPYRIGEARLDAK